jgi:uncharacterized membrane protein YbhN (UPF0104 family)
VSIAPSATDLHPSHRRGLAGRPWWTWLKRLLTVLFFAGVAWLLWRQAHVINWDEVWHTLRGYPAPVLAVAAALAVASHVLYSCLDLLGRAHTGHGLGARRVMLTAFVSYTFNLNFGAMVGGVAFRYRLYSRLGLDPGKTSTVVLVSMVTNWLGYAFLAGVLFVALPFEVPADWVVGAATLRAFGALLIAIAAAYVAACGLSSRRDWTLRGYTLRLPSWRFALLQLAISSLNWALIGGIVYVLLQPHVDYATTLTVMLVAAVAGVLAHVPAGLGVIEAVFVALLAPGVPTGALLAALLAYRGLYYWAPLVIATVVHLGVETLGRRARRAS